MGKQWYVVIDRGNGREVGIVEELPRDAEELTKRLRCVNSPQVEGCFYRGGYDYMPVSEKKAREITSRRKAEEAERERQRALRKE